MKDETIILRKMVEYIRQAQEYVKEHCFESFMADNKTIYAAAFAICQFSELTQQLKEETRQAYSAIPWAQIRGIRNRIVHNYDSVDFKILWNIIKSDLPKLEQEIGKMLGNIL